MCFVDTKKNKEPQLCLKGYINAALSSLNEVSSFEGNPVYINIQIQYSDRVYKKETRSSVYPSG